MYVDFKVTTWYRCEIPEQFDNAVIEALIDGKITCSDDIGEFAEDMEWMELTEFQEEISVEDNDGYSTIEAYRNNKCIYTNENDIETKLIK